VKKMAGAVRVFLEIVVSSGMALCSEAPRSGPPFPTARFFRLDSALTVEFSAQACSSLVLFLPVLGAVFLPVLAELRAE
jgi:hypothetical protein